LVIALTAAAFIGVVLVLQSGEWLGRQQATAAKTGALNSLLTENVHGWTTGQPPPRLSLWSPNGSVAAELPDLVTSEALLFYVMAKCGACVEAVAVLDSVANVMGDRALPVIVIASSEPHDLLAGLQARGVTIPVWVDQEDRMLGEYNIRTTRTWFRITDGVLVDMGTAEFNAAEYERILSR